MLSIHNVYTANELRKALGIVYNLIRIENEDETKALLKQARKDDTKDKIQYIYHFLTHLAYLGREIDEWDEEFEGS